MNDAQIQDIIKRHKILYKQYKREEQEVIKEISEKLNLSPYWDVDIDDGIIRFTSNINMVKNDIPRILEELESVCHHINCHYHYLKLDDTCVVRIDFHIFGEEK